MRVTLPGAAVRSVTWPEGAGADGFDRRVRVEHRGEAVGEIAVAKAPGDPVTAADDRLLGALASQAGVALRNAGLAVELAARLEEVEEQAADLARSRQRIVAARDAERRRLERDLADRIEVRLDAVESGLRATGARLGEDPAGAAALLEQIEARAGEAAEALRDLAHGIFPPLEALRGRESGRGFAPVIDLSLANGALTLVVEGVAGAARAQPMADRIEALGGTLEASERPGGWRLVAQIPSAALEGVR